jgi:hypothetical protein
MNKTEERTAEPKSAQQKEGRDLWGALWRLGGTEKVLAVACGAVLIGFLFDKSLSWGAVFGTWHGVMAFSGAIGAMALILLRALRIRLLPKAHEARALMILALLPAGGLVIQALQNPWGFVLFGGMIGMAYAGLRLAGLLGDDDEEEEPAGRA